MIGALIYISFIIWVSLQTRESRQPVWSSRFERYCVMPAALVKNALDDVRAIKLNVRVRRETRKWEL